MSRASFTKMVRQCVANPARFCLIASLPLASANAETLAQAIAFAYQSNPTLQAERAQLRATDEGYVQARSGYGPTVQLQATASYNQDRLRNSFSGDIALDPTTSRTNFGSGRIIVDQPLYSGGRTTLEVHGAQERIRAAREALRATEQNVVFSVIQAYVDVERDVQAVAIRRTNLDALTTQLAETKARARAGEVTRTDVAQAEAQLHAEEANVAAAENQLLASRAAYTTVVGRNPGTLQKAPPLPGMPTNADRAFAIADQASPEFQQAQFTERVSRANVQVARTAERPTISLRGTYGYSATLDPFNGRDRDRALTGQAVLSIPIFTSGRVSSQIRQALDLNTSDRLSIEGARRSMVQNVANAWNQMVTFGANIARQDAQVAAAEIAFRGMRIEYRAGQRSTLDVLIAEQTLRDAELARATAQHDAYIASALVLRYVGRLDARDIVEGVDTYDPAEHLRRVEHRGVLPWEPAIRLLDGFGTPRAGQRSIPAPRPSQHPKMAANTSAAPQLVKQLPIAPLPGTVSNAPAVVLQSR